MEGLASQLIRTYLDLDQQTNQLKTAIRSLDPDYGAFTLGLNDNLWRHQPEQTINPTTQSANAYHQYWASEIIGCLDHRHDGDGRDSWQMAGALVVPDAIMTLTHTLNQTKAEFARLIQAYRQQQNTPTTPLQLQRLFQTQALAAGLGSGADARAVLKRLGATRIHLRHCTRQIVCLQEYPKFMSLSWVRQRRSIQKISIDQCIEKLEKLNRDSQSNHITCQIQALSQLPLNQHHLLRQVQTVKYPSIKTKIYWEDGSDSHLGYLSMPALIPAGTLKQLPPMTNISPTPPQKRAQRRSDNRLPEEPFCPSIRVYLARAGSTQSNPLTSKSH